MLCFFSLKKLWRRRSEGMRGEERIDVVLLVGRWLAGLERARNKQNFSKAIISFPHVLGVCNFNFSSHTECSLLFCFLRVRKTFVFFIPSFIVA